MEATTAPQPAVWAGDPTLFGWAWGEPAVIAGEDAVAVAEAAQAAGGPPIAYAAAGWALLTRTPPADGLDEATVTASGLPDASVATVVLRHAWQGPEQVVDAVDEAARITRPGGQVILADWDLSRVLTASPRLYTDAFFYAALPGVAARLEESLAFRLDLPVALNRAGLRRITAAEVDEVAAVFASRDAYVAWLRQRGFRGMQHADPEAVAAAFAALPDLVRRIAPIGAVTHRDPWRVAAGVV